MNKKSKNPSLLDWQKEALGQSLESTLVDFLVIAGVGAGKTRFACEHASALLIAGIINRIIIVCNTRHLVKQWGRAMKALGINIKEAKTNNDLRDGLETDVCGYCTTYQALGTFDDLHESMCAQAKTLVIFDEIHHLGESPEGKNAKPWGENAKKSFARAARRLALSGTPRRSDNNLIPFIRYKDTDDGKKLWITDPPYGYFYSYGRSVVDGVCRRVIFKPFDAEEPDEQGRKIVFDLDGKQYNLSFKDKCDELVDRRRLQWAVEPRTISGGTNNLLFKMIKAADRRLQDLRSSGHSDAGGIIIAHDAAHARKIRKFLKDHTGQEAVLVLYDEEGSDTSIDSFRKGSVPWIISVRMVSEGVDIPRLRVCVFCARITEKLFFTQVMGRIVRKPEGSPQNDHSYFFFPADQRLVEAAEEVEADILAAFKEAKTKDPGGEDGDDGDGDEPVEHSSNFIHAHGDETENLIGGDKYDSILLDRVDLLRRTDPSLRDIPISVLLQFAKNLVEKEAQQPNFYATPDGDVKSHSEEVLDLRREIQAGVGYLFKLLDERTPYDHIQATLNKRARINRPKKATLEELKRKKIVLDEWIAIAKKGENTPEDEEDEE